MACLAGDGVGPELMGEASRALAAVARLHSLQIDDVHLPFGGEAFTRFGHPLPLSTREAYSERRRDPRLLAAATPALRRRQGRPRPRLARLARAQRRSRGDLVVVEPLGTARTSSRSRGRSRSRRRAGPAHLGRLDGRSGTRSSPRRRTSWDGLEVELLTLRDVLARFRDRPGTVDLVVAPGHFAGAIVDAAAHLAGSLHTVASGCLSQHGPGVFAAEVCDDERGRRLRRRGRRPARCSPRRCCSARASAAAPPHARSSGPSPPTRQRHQATTDTRSFTDAVIGALPDARTDTELFEEVWR